MNTKRRFATALQRQYLADSEAFILSLEAAALRACKGGKSTPLSTLRVALAEALTLGRSPALDSQPSAAAGVAAPSPLAGAPSLRAALAPAPSLAPALSSAAGLSTAQSHSKASLGGLSAQAKEAAAADALAAAVPESIDELLARACQLGSTSAVLQQAVSGGSAKLEELSRGFRAHAHLLPEQYFDLKGALAWWAGRQLERGSQSVSEMPEIA